MSEPNKFNLAMNKLRTVALAGLLLASSKESEAKTPQSKPKTETVEKKSTTKTQQKLLTKTYKITDRQSFDNLWNDAKPLCVPVLVLSENWRLDFHHDRGQKKTPNSVLAGLYYYPKNGKFTSTTWIKTSQYFINYQNNHRGKSPKNRAPQDIRDGIYGWGQAMDNGQHLNDLYAALKGSELTVNEFAAIYSHYFHTGNTKAARKIASIKNKDKSLACAQVLLDTDPTSLKGQKNRFMHEALVFLNEDNYCSDLFSLCVDCYLGSSINACPEEFTNVNEGKLTHKKAQKIKEKICNYTVRNGKQIKVLCKQIDDKTIMAFCFETQKSKQLDERNAIYQRALKAYNNQDYKNAKKLFQQVMEKHGEGPDLWNDMAITYYKLDEYENCIEMCRKVLTSGEHKEYAKACYNAGRAYEDMGNYARALKNYTSALEFYNKYGIADKDQNVNYESIYNKSIKRVQEQINKTPTKKTIKTKQNKNNKNKANKAKAFVLAGLVVANKNQRRQYTKTTNKSRAY